MNSTIIKSVPGYVASLNTSEANILESVTLLIAFGLFCLLINKIRSRKKSELLGANEPERSDGSVGWFENVEGSHLSEKQILLAQLAELRTIKRCVVCTILIVIVIPIVFGVTR